MFCYIIVKGKSQNRENLRNARIKLEWYLGETSYFDYCPEKPCFNHHNSRKTKSNIYFTVSIMFFDITLINYK